MSTSNNSEGFTIGELFGALRRKPVIVILFLLLGLAGAVLIGLRGGGRYEATSQVVLQPVFSARTSLPRAQDQINLSAERSLLLSTPVAQKVIDQLHLDTTPKDLLSRVTVTSPDSGSVGGTEGSLTMDLVVEGENATNVGRTANAFASEYLDARERTSKALQSDAIGALDDESAKVQQSLEKATATVVAAGANSSLAAQGKIDQDIYSKRIEAIDSARANLLSANTNPGIVSVTSSGGEKAGIPIWVKGLGVALLLFSIGVVIAFLLDRGDPRFHGIDELRERLDPVPVAAFASAASPRRTEDLARLAVRLAPHSPNRSSSALLCGMRQPPGDLARGVVEAYEDSSRRILVVWASDEEPPTEALDLLQFIDGIPISPNGSNPQTMWLRPTETGDLRTLLRADRTRSLIDRAAREGYEVALFVSRSPIEQAVALSLGNEVDNVVIRVEPASSVDRVTEALDLFESVGAPVPEVLVG